MFFWTSNFSLLSKVVTFREFSLGWSEANIGGEVCPVASRWLSAPFVLEFSAKKIPTKRWSEAFQSLKSGSTLEPQVLKFGDYKKLWSFISYIASFLPKHHSCFSGKKKGFIFLKHRMWLCNLFTCSILGYLCWAATPALQGMYETINLRAGCSPKRPTYIPSKSTVISQMLHRYLA